jgi:hypothetical protein
VAPREEVLAHLARLLESEELREATDEAARERVNTRFWALAESLMEEAAVSDDVHDRASAEMYLAERVTFLSVVLTDEQASRLRETLMMGVASW